MKCAGGMWGRAPKIKNPGHEATDTQLQGGGKLRPGTISQGKISPGENFATLEIPKAPSKHVSRKMSLDFQKKNFVSRSLYAP